MTLLDRDTRGRFTKDHKAWNKGIPRTEATKKKISASRMGKPPTSGSYQKGNERWKLRKRTGMRKGQTNTGSFEIGHETWNKANGRGPYPVEFNELLKEAIRQRDGYRCQTCGIHQDELYRALDVHHIDGNKQNNRKDNLISYCQTGHKDEEMKLIWMGVIGHDT